ncbi:DUF4241 domain-containing protein [Myroides sp. WP-1]|uniref:DUF4241 domain-containing protein n=1 Tax=Myroides sp. WP-1 TaxID=2759944 RepID=UPI0015FBE2D2|nr:DUF4241 domain-containing protein [Myroides sp. WP-1]MBB1140846.1 DUF4241 domain-containing protein [Myroides sp. WP-1]
MKTIPTPEWITVYEQKKHLLLSPTNFNHYFSATSICEKNLFHLNLGEVKFPTGNILVRDPLVYLKSDEQPYFIPVAQGSFPLTVLVMEVDEDHYRYVAFRVKVSDKQATQHLEALLGHENIDTLNKGEYFGFNVDAGLATIVDVETKDAYCAFEQQWLNAHPGGNIYDDFLAAEFKKSYANNPQYQRPGGDWINFKIPGTDLTIPMIQSGYGDGAYPVYFGYDENNEVCEIIVQFIDIELTFEDEEE